MGGTCGATSTTALSFGSFGTLFSCRIGIAAVGMLVVLRGASDGGAAVVDDDVVVVVVVVGIG